MFPTFRREQVFLSARFHRRWPTEVNWLQLLPLLVSSLPDRSRRVDPPNSGSPPQGFGSLLLPLGTISILLTNGLETREKKIKFRAHFMCKNRFFFRESVGVFSRRRAHTLSTEFSTRSGHRFQMFLMKGFYKQLCDRFSRYLGLARASFCRPLFVG
jgi:hypothetical protein